MVLSRFFRGLKLSFRGIWRERPWDLHRVKSRSLALGTSGQNDMEGQH